MLDVVEFEPVTVQLTFDYSDYSPQLVARLEQHALNMEGFTKRYATTMGKELAEAKAEIHEEKQTGWAKWVEGRLGITVRWANKIIEQYEKEKSGTNFPISPPDIRETTQKIQPSTHKSLTYVHDEFSQDEPWLDNHAQETGYEFKPDAYIPPKTTSEPLYAPPITKQEPIKPVEVDEWVNPVPANRGVPPALQSSDSNEWYTPSPYVNAARALMGMIDIDPASCERANQIVQAKQFYTEQDNGLDHDWEGRVWLNPPYGFTDGRSNQEIWTQKLIQEYSKGVTEAVLLVNANTEAKWFQPLYDYLICLTDHRIRFYSPNGESSQPTQGNALVYFGKQRKRFIEIFSKFGTVIERAAVDECKQSR